MKTMLKVHLLGALLLTLLTGTAHSDDYTKTRYPIVLVHGLAGFDNIAGVMGYWHGIPEALKSGGAEVYVAQVAAAQDTVVRGEQLLKQVEDILAESGAEKVNLIGHSHGVPTSRYVASVRPDIIASVSGVAGVNWGARLADVLQSAKENIPVVGEIAAYVIAGVMNAVMKVIDLMSGGGYEQDILASMKAMTTEGTVAFNRKYPEGMPTEYCGEGDEEGSNGVFYYSWSGALPWTGVTFLFDPSDYAFIASSVIFNEKNDGLVASCSSHLGMVIRDDYPMNHLDEVNQIMGMRWPWLNPVSLYRQQANRLKAAGL